MADQLRWILAVLSALLLAGIWWWGTRRSRQSPGNAELRESLAAGAPSKGPVDAEENFPPMPRAHESSRDWGVPPLEPLSIRTAEFEAAEFEDLPMTAQSDPLESTFDLGVAEREAAAPKFVRVPTLRMNDAVPATAPEEAADMPPEAPGSLPTTPASPVTAGPAAASAPEVAAEGPNAEQAQHIVGVRVCAVGDARWAGADVIAALDQQGLTHGRYQVFHRRHAGGRTLFCAASLVEPGTFNISRMPEEEFRGLSLFAVLPGPGEPVQTLEAMIATAAALAQTLQGVVQDGRGAPMSQQRAEALRDEVAHFQSQLSMH